MAAPLHLSLSVKSQLPSPIVHDNLFGNMLPASPLSARFSKEAAPDIFHLAPKLEPAVRLAQPLYVGNDRLARNAF